MTEKWKATLYYDGGFLRESAYEFDSEQEAMDEVDYWINEYIEKWKLDDAWHEDDSIDFFSADYDLEYVEEEE